MSGGLDNTRLLLPPSNGAASRRKRNAKEHKQREVDRRKQSRLSLFADRREAGIILPEERVCGCGKIPVSAPGARIEVHGDKGKYFTGVMNCGSVWNCPVCAKKIGLHRAQTVTEMLRAFQKERNEYGNKYSLGFLTLTVRHNRKELLADVLKRVLESFREIEQSREFREYKKDIDYFGCIRTVEVKHGGNGWHPHLHLLLIAECGENTLKGFSDFFVREWLARNPDATNEAQKYLPVRCDKGISKYVTKWDAASEMTMGGAKTKGDSLTPFQMLRVHSHFRALSRTPKHWVTMKKYQNLFIEYSVAMKGKKQLTVARDLIREYEKITGKKFSIKSDDELNVEKQNEKKIVEIDRELFKMIVAYRLQCVVLNEIEFHGIEKCVELLNDYEIECEYDSERNIIKIPDPPEPFEISSDDWKYNRWLLQETN